MGGLLCIGFAYITDFGYHAFWTPWLWLSHCFCSAGEFAHRHLLHVSVSVLFDSVFKLWWLWGSHAHICSTSPFSSWYDRLSFLQNCGKDWFSVNRHHLLSWDKLLQVIFSFTRQCYTVCPRFSVFVVQLPNFIGSCVEGACYKLLYIYIYCIYVYIYIYFIYIHIDILLYGKITVMFQSAPPTSDSCNSKSPCPSGRTCGSPWVYPPSS